MAQKKLLLEKYYRVNLHPLHLLETQGPWYNSKAPMLSEESVIEHSLHSESNFFNIENDNILRPLPANDYFLESRFALLYQYLKKKGREGRGRSKDPAHLSRFIKKWNNFIMKDIHLSLHFIVFFHDAVCLFKKFHSQSLHHIRSQDFNHSPDLVRN